MPLQVSQAAKLRSSKQTEELKVELLPLATHKMAGGGKSKSDSTLDFEFPVLPTSLGVPSFSKSALDEIPILP